MKNPEENSATGIRTAERSGNTLQSWKIDGAYYLAGYSIELTLKAKLCEHLGIDNLSMKNRQPLFMALATLEKRLKHMILLFCLFLPV